MKFGLATIVLLQATAPLVSGFVTPKSHVQHLFTASSSASWSSSTSPATSLLQVASSAASGETPKEEKAKAPAKKKTALKQKKKTLKELREEGGFTTFNTPIGALNLFAIYYGVMSLALGLPWFLGLKLTQFMYWITGERFDKKVRQSICMLLVDAVYSITMNLPGGSFVK